jgi:hypothetical protein
VTTVAPTTPVEAASSAPTMMTEMPEAAAHVAEQLAHRRQQLLGDRERSSITPMKMKSGTATSTSFVMKPI